MTEDEALRAMTAEERKVWEWYRGTVRGRLSADQWLKRSREKKMEEEEKQRQIEKRNREQYEQARRNDEEFRRRKAELPSHILSYLASLRNENVEQVYARKFVALAPKEREQFLRDCQRRDEERERERERERQE